MKFLHTADWHVGKTLKGRNRIAEQTEVLREIVQIVRDGRFDAVLVAGDLYETSAPTAEAQRLVLGALWAFRQTGAEVVAIGGNHDHGAALDALRPLTQAVGIHLIGMPRRAAQGGMVSFTARSSGERVNIAALPFVSQRYAIRAAELLTGTPAENVGRHDQHVRAILAELTSGFTPDAVNVVIAHLTVLGGRMGGGERAAQSVFEYAIPAAVFGTDPHYVALGHLHRRQAVPAPCPVHYSGSPIAVDFGEESNTPVVLSVEATPTTPAAVTEIPLTTARRLRTERGTAAELAARADEFGDDYLRLYLREPARAGLREDVQHALPNALEIRIDPDYAAAATASRPAARPDRTPGELFAAYCAEHNAVDGRVQELFARLHDEVSSR